MEWLLIILFLVVVGLFESTSSRRKDNHSKPSKPADRASYSPKPRKSSYTSSDLTKAPDYDWKAQERDNETMRQAEPLKARGDGYELHIGRMFERKGDLVIYNGFLRGYEDQGVDLIVISKNEPVVNLVQCKHWKRFEFTPQHLESIYKKLSNYRRDYAGLQPEAIRHYHAIHLSDREINNMLSTSYQYQIRKTLYLASRHVISKETETLLTPIAETIFRYKDMKIVFFGID